MVEGESGVLFTRLGRAGIVTLNRPRALNALTLAMVRAIRARLDAWADDAAVERVIIEGAGERAFCAGGDIRRLHEWGTARDSRFLDFYREEYGLIARIRHYPKPYVALIDGIVMGGGAGLSMHGGTRIAGDDILFAMPETGIGLFPDVGGSYFLPRLAGKAGIYLALTGARLKLADCVAAGLATHHVPSSDFAALRQALAEAPDIAAALAPFAQPTGPAPLQARQGTIDAAFAGAGVEGILANLDAVTGEDREWAQATAATIRAKSPTSLKITHRQMREGARLAFDDCMRMELRIVYRIFDGHDFFEGVRAVLIDKDNAPRWRPDSLEQVTDADVARYFAPLDGAELDPSG